MKKFAAFMSILAFIAAGVALVIAVSEFIARRRDMFDCDSDYEDFDDDLFDADIDFFEESEPLASTVEANPAAPAPVENEQEAPKE